MRHRRSSSADAESPNGKVGLKTEVERTIEEAFGPTVSRPTDTSRSKAAATPLHDDEDDQAQLEWLAEHIQRFVP